MSDRSSGTYHVGRSTISIIFGDLTTSDAEVLVSSDDCYLSAGGGVSQALVQKCGMPYSGELSKHGWPQVTADRLPVAGDVVVTGAGNHPARYVFHAISLAPQMDAPPHEVTVRRACRRVMELLPMVGCRRVAFSCIGTGHARMDPRVAGEQMAAVLVSVLLDADEAYEVELYLMDRWFNRGNADRFFASFEECVSRTLALGVSGAGEDRSLTPPTDPASPAKERERARRFDIYTMLRRLDQRRDELDTSLLEVLFATDTDASPLEELQRQLETVHRLREIYEAELVLPANPAYVEAGSVFLSSTWQDLQRYRAEAKRVIEASGLSFIGMEQFMPAGVAPVDLIRKEVNRAAVYVGLLGSRYGFVDPALGFSMTELEYRQAVAARKPRHVFVMGDDTAVPLCHVERDPEGVRKLAEFRQRVLKENTVLFFSDPLDLGRKLAATLGGVGSIRQEKENEKEKE
jgi:O-acetyl-ADP-ribose deacetylase (regulator of RNase III)